VKRPNVPLFRDDNHLSEAGSRQVAAGLVQLLQP
jgi:hypothetical protein